MSKITFPPLPERAGYAPALKGDIYTAEQMQERDRQIAECVIRACAQVCRNEADDFAEMIEGSRDARYDHMGDGATTCAESILALLPVKEPRA